MTPENMRRSVRGELSVLLWLAVSFAPAFAQEPPTLSVDVDLITLTATVTSRSGSYLGALRKEEFLVYEDGVLQKIAVFEPDQVPVSLGIVIDTSGSMVDKIDDVQDAVIHFARMLNPKDEIFVLRFSEDVDLVLKSTGARDALAAAVRRLRPGGSTHLYDAIAEGLELASHGGYRKKALLVITDGNDTASSWELDDVLQLAQHSEVLIYALGIGHSERGSLGHSLGTFRDVDMGVLNSFAGATGGKSYHLEATHSGGRDLIDQACQTVSAELRQQYTLGYYPTNAARDGMYRRIRVEMRNPDYVIRTRPGYYAPTQKK